MYIHCFVPQRNIKKNPETVKTNFVRNLEQLHVYNKQANIDSRKRTLRNGRKALWLEMAADHVPNVQPWSSILERAG
jgi:hypothetical protein